MKVRKYYFFCLLGIFLVACSQNYQVKQQDFFVGESKEFIIVPDGLSVQDSEDRLVVRLEVAEDEDDPGKRFGQVIFNWTGSSTLSGTVNLSLRKGDGAPSQTLDCGGTCSTLEAPIASNSTIYIDPDETSHKATTPKTTMVGQLCVDIDGWNLYIPPESAPIYTFNNQQFPLTLCQRNAGESGADMTVLLDGHSSTEGVLGQTFPFIVAVENLGPRPADEVKLTIELPRIVRFVEDQTTKYNCEEQDNSSRKVVICTTTERVVPERRSLPLILKAVRRSKKNKTYNVEVLVEIMQEDSTIKEVDPDPSNDELIQEIKVTPVIP